jgi:hypothetical protein
MYILKRVGGHDRTLWHPCLTLSILVISDEKMGLSVMNMLGLSSSVHFAHIACYWIFFAFALRRSPLSVQAFRIGHAYLTYLTLQRLPNHLNGRKLDHLQVLNLLYFLCLASPCLIPRTCSFSWFRMASACFQQNFVI